MRIFVTGAEGQLGAEICRISKHDNFGTYLEKHGTLINTEYVQLDITKRELVFETIKKIEPEWVIHCAALTDVDLCEQQQDAAWSVNVNATKNITDASKAVGAKVLYVSTDYVFDGKKGMYKEYDQPNPLNYYGKTKLEGEKVIQSLNNSIIIRSSVMYSRDRHNFLLWVLDKLKEGEIGIVTDQINSPTFNTELAECILELIKIDATGLYHTAGDERISRFDFGRKIAETFGFDNSLIKPIKTAQLNQKARRPVDASLDISKVKKLGIKFSNVENALKKLKEQMKQKRNKDNV